MKPIAKLNFAAKRVSAKELREVFESSGIKRPDNIKRLGKMIKHSNLVVTAMDNGKLVGIARALTDFSWVCYVSDIAVRKEYQKRGIGKRLVAEIRKALGSNVMILLLSAPEAEKFYPKIGFERVKNAWRIPRKA
ncbi:MAG: GNAT family N-acetyltransferase [Candidatus Aenigmarchaeota archaeon]|nr:GNAT family N-acetyltransferase [Candidatus Aenigmarchaeota archaeon]